MMLRPAILIAATLLALNGFAQPATQKSAANGVTVAVTAVSFAADEKVWQFNVALDTHSGELSDDLLKSAVLVDDKGAEFRPLAWEGAGPGGHHRSGVLRFAPISPRPQAATLRITRTGESAARVFVWQLN